MAKIPGQKAEHAIITPQCVVNRGQLGAIEEALRRIKLEFLGLAPIWEGRGANFHVVLTVERQTEQEDD